MDLSWLVQRKTRATISQHIWVWATIWATILRYRDRIGGDRLPFRTSFPFDVLLNWKIFPASAFFIPCHQVFAYIDEISSPSWTVPTVLSFAYRKGTLVSSSFWWLSTGVPPIHPCFCHTEEFRSELWTPDVSPQSYPQNQQSKSFAKRY